MPLCRTLCALALADTLLAALPTRANAEVRFEGNAFKAPADWATFPNARPGSWQIQRRLEVGRDRSTSCGPSPAATRC